MSNTMVRGSNKWTFYKSWIGAFDTLLTTFPSSARPSGMIPCNGLSGIILRGWGQDANNEAVGIQISGWMNNCPGQLLWAGTATLGAQSNASETLDGKVTSGTWFDVDTWTAASNAAQAESFGVDDQASILVLPTHKYSHIHVEVEVSTAANFVIFWCPQVTQIVI